MYNFTFVTPFLLQTRSSKFTQWEGQQGFTEADPHQEHLSPFSIRILRFFPSFALILKEYQLSCRRVRLDQNEILLSCLCWHCSTLALIGFNIVYTVLQGELIYFPPCSDFPHRRNVASLSVFYCYFHGKYSFELYCSVAPVQTFTAWTHHATFTESKHSNLPRILRPTQLPPTQELLLYGANSHMYVSLNIAILKSSNQGSVIIYPPFTS